MIIRLIHGFNVLDRGKTTTDQLTPHLKSEGLSVFEHDYGWVGLIGLRWRNDRVVRGILPMIEPGDVLIAHSNGCLIAWELAKAGAPLSAVICIQPALRRDTLWPASLPVLCLFNRSDWTVELGRVWGRFVSVVNPLRNRHGWGAAGRHGFTSGQSLVENWNTELGDKPASRHSDIFRGDSLGYWVEKIVRWLRDHTASS